MKRMIWLAAGVIIIAIAVIRFAGIAGDNEITPKEVQDIKQMVHGYTIRTLQAESASITSKQLIVTESGSKTVTYDLPEDEFFVSIAPYIEKTHPCAIHSLTGCQGEMVEQEFDISIEDANGNVVVNQTMKSEANGFIDLWLPRDQTYQVTIKHDDKAAISEISTFEDADTCITNMKLS